MEAQETIRQRVTRIEAARASASATHRPAHRTGHAAAIDGDSLAVGRAG